MNFVFHPEAEAEFQFAIDYYEEVEPGLGYDFALEVLDAIHRAIDIPLAWTELTPYIRRSLVHRFPYGVLYGIENGTLYVIAVMNLHRHPDYWKVRL